MEGATLWTTDREGAPLGVKGKTAPQIVVVVKGLSLERTRAACRHNHPITRKWGYAALGKRTSTVDICDVFLAK